MNFTAFGVIDLVHRPQVERIGDQGIERVGRNGEYPAAELGISLSGEYANCTESPFSISAAENGAKSTSSVTAHAT